MLRILAVSSPGGVLLDILALEPWLSTGNVEWVSVHAPDTRRKLEGRPVTWLDEVAAERAYTLPAAVIGAFCHMRRSRPDVIVSAGTGVAVAYFVAARLLRIPAVWVETFNIVEAEGRAARICGRLATTTLVHRPARIRAHARSVLVGELY